MSKFFSKRLYAEGLARVRTPGIIAAVLITVFSVATPLNQLLDDLVNKPTLSEGITVMTASDLLTPLFLLLLAVPCFAFTSFGFLNKRHSSDFYHALPYTRSSIFVSFLLGILTWTVGIAFVSMLLRALFFALHPQVVVRFGTVMLGTFSYVVGCMVLLGYLLLAFAFTGTRFSNIAVFFILFALPRYFMSTFLQLLGGFVPMIDVESLPYALFGGQYSLVRILLSNVISVNHLFLNIWLILLHLVWALVLLVLGGLVFHKRKSETAGTPATSRLMQHIWRLAVATPFALLAVTVAMETFHEGMESPAVGIIAGLFFVFLSALSYIFYELLSTGKLKRFGTMARYFLFLLIPMALLVCLVLGVQNTVLHREIQRQDIVSVTFTNGYDYGFDQPWEDLQTANLVITDPEIISIVHQNYQETLSASQKGLYDETLRKMGEEGRVLNVTITTKNGKTRTYNLLFTATEYADVEQRKMEIAEYRDAYLSMPEEKTVNYFLINGAYVDDAGVYGAFLSVYEKLTVEEKTALKEGWGQNVVFEFYISGNYKNTGREYYSRYNITAEMTEMVSVIRRGIEQASWIGASEEFSTNLEAAKKVAERITQRDFEEYFYMEIVVVSGMKTRELFYQNENELKKESPNLQSIAQEILAYESDVDSPHYIVLHFYGDIDESYESFVVSLSISEELAAHLLALESAY